jgi:hypothetical protein
LVPVVLVELNNKGKTEEILRLIQLLRLAVVVAVNGLLPVILEALVVAAVQDKIQAIQVAQVLQDKEMRVVLVIELITLICLLVVAVGLALLEALPLVHNKVALAE